VMVKNEHPFRTSIIEVNLVSESENLICITEDKVQRRLVEGVLLSEERHSPFLVHAGGYAVSIL
ncbi:9773_t:CDS:2, partial [Funneliformis caledonium]